MNEKECAETATHQAHMELNGECPMCGALGRSNPDLDSMSESEAIEFLGERYSL